MAPFDPKLTTFTAYVQETKAAKKRPSMKPFFMGTVIKSTNQVNPKLTFFEPYVHEKKGGENNT
jgi:hypothetical protein